MQRRQYGGSVVGTAMMGSPAAAAALNQVYDGGCQDGVRWVSGDVQVMLMMMMYDGRARDGAGMTTTTTGAGAGSVRMTTMMMTGCTTTMMMRMIASCKRRR